MATGSDPIVPPIPGLRELEGVWGTREATSMKAVPRRLLVLGGGSAGVEVAQVVRRLGGEAVLIEGANRVLPAKARLAVPLFAGTPLGFQLLAADHKLFAPPPSHVVPATAGRAQIKAHKQSVRRASVGAKPVPVGLQRNIVTVT